jgi:hypothetical protein
LSLFFSGDCGMFGSRSERTLGEEDIVAAGVCKKKILGTMSEGSLIL